MMVPAEESLKGRLDPRGATPDAIDMMERQLGILLPESYRRFLSRSNGCDGPIGDQWIILYPAEAVVAETAKHRLSTGVEDAVFNGTDGGGEACVLDTRADPTRFGSMPFIGSGLADVWLHADSLDEFVRELSDS